MESNPYTSPSSNLFGASGGTVTEGVVQGVISQLQRTRPWVMFLSIMAFLFAAFMVVMGGVMLLAGAAGSMAAGGMAAGGTQPGLPPGFQMAIMVGVAVFYLVNGFLYIYPGIKLWKYGARIADLVRSRSTVDLELALNEQRVVWKFAGILMIITIVFIVGFFVLALVAGASAMGQLR